jgi:hypothetical protein
MARRRVTAKSRAASRRNLERARAARRRKVFATVAGVGAVTTAGVVARHKLSGSKLSYNSGPNVSTVTGSPLGRGTSIGRNHLTVKTATTRRTLSYTHRKLDHGPRDVIRHMPGPAKVSRRRFERYNVAHTPQQKVHSAQRIPPNSVLSKSAPGARRISEFEAVQRTNSYMNSRRFKGSTRTQNRLRQRVLNEYRKQPRYDASRTAATRKNRRRNMGR